MSQDLSTTLARGRPVCGHLPAALGALSPGGGASRGLVDCWGGGGRRRERVVQRCLGHSYRYLTAWAVGTSCAKSGGIAPSPPPQHRATHWSSTSVRRRPAVCYAMLVRRLSRPACPACGGSKVRLDRWTAARGSKINASKRRRSLESTGNRQACADTALRQLVNYERTALVDHLRLEGTNARHDSGLWARLSVQGLSFWVQAPLRPWWMMPGLRSMMFCEACLLPNVVGRP